ncbi:hypothetical protein [Clostridium sp.]
MNDNEFLKNICRDGIIEEDEDDDELAVSNGSIEENSVLLLELQEELESAIKYEEVEGVKIILAKADLAAAKDQYGIPLFENVIRQIQFAPGIGQMKDEYDNDYETYFEMFKCFVEHGSMKKLNLNDYKNQPLSYTIYKNHIEVAKIMLENGANPNEKNNKQTFIEENICNMNSTMLKLFIDFGLRLPNGKRAGELLNIVLGNEKIDDEMVKKFVNMNSVKLLQKEKYISDGLSNRSSEILKLLLNNGLVPNEGLLKSVCKYSSFENIKMLCDSLSKEEFSQLKIKYSVRYLDMETLKYLYSKGYKFKDNQLKYIFEMHNKDIDRMFEVLVFMLENGSSLRIDDTDKENGKEIWTNEQNEYESKYIQMYSVFSYSTDKNLEKIKKLICFMFDNGWESTLDSSTLSGAITNGNLKLAKYLMEEFNIYIDEEETAKIVRYIIQYNPGNVSAFKFIKDNFKVIISSKKVKLDSIYMDLEKAKRNLIIYTDDYKPTNLSAFIKDFIKNEDIEAIDCLIKKKTINKRNINSYLNYAIEKKSETIIAILLEAKGGIL